MKIAIYQVPILSVRKKTVFVRNWLMTYMLVVVLMMAPENGFDGRIVKYLLLSTCRIPQRFAHRSFLSHDFHVKQAPINMDLALEPNEKILLQIGRVQYAKQIGNLVVTSNRLLWSHPENRVVLFYSKISSKPNQVPVVI